jgi:hypothetical protein
MERASTITYLKGETTGTELEGREGERPARLGESTIPFPIRGKSFPKSRMNKPHGTLSHRLPFQISGLHEKTKRGKAKIKAKENTTLSNTKTLEFFLLHKA